MSTEANKDVVQRFFQAGNSGDMDTCMSLIADDIVWTNIGTHSLSGTFRGKQELGERLLGPLFGQLQQGIHMTPQQLIAENDTVVAHCQGRAQTHDGRPYNNTYCWIIRIRDGQFVELTEFGDTELIKAVFG